MGGPHYRRFLILGTVLLALTALFAVALPVAHAVTSFSIEDIGGSVGLGTADLRQTVVNVIRWVLGILGLVAVSFIIYGGVLWMTAAGNEERIDRAKRVITNAVIGLVIVLLSWAIVSYVARSFSNATSSTGDGTPVPPPPVPVNEFRVRQVQTAHAGSRTDQAIYRCSRLQPIFNNAVDPATVAAVLAASPKALIVKNASDSEVAGTWVYGASKSMTYTPDVKFDEGTYTLDIPKGPNGLKDLSLPPKLLTQCLADGSCADLGNTFRWTFSVGSEDDAIAPSVTSTYPVRTGTSYPDTDVTREPVITVDFSESIDLSSVKPADTVRLQQLTGKDGEVVMGGPLDVVTDGIIDADFLTVTPRAKGFDISLSATAPDKLVAFTWYRLTVENVRDLCGNPMVPIEPWQFQTNDQVAGIQSVNPSGTGQCVDQREVFVVFSTTMYDNEVRMQIAQDGVPFEDVLLQPSSGTTTDEGTRGSFVVADITSPVDNGYRVFKYTATDAWAIDKTYEVAVTTNRKLDAAGTLLTRTWTFGTADPASCRCTPYVATIDPGSGTKGQCLSVVGSCFAGTTEHAATPQKPAFSLDFASSPVHQGDLLGSGPTAVVTKLPTAPEFVSGTKPAVRITIDYEDPTFGTVESNPNVRYSITSDDATAGPCLTSLDRSSGTIGDANAANGKDFGAEGPGSSVTYSAGNPASISSWSATKVSHIVPGAIDPPASLNVRVTDSAGKASNALPFSLLKVVPPDGATPVVRRFDPNCASACPNAGMTVQFALGSGDMDPLEVVKPANYAIKECQDAGCGSFTPTVFTPNSFAYDTVTKTVQFGKSPTFELNTSYRLILSKSLKSDADKELGNLNYDSDADGTLDSFTWTFRTKATACALSSVSVSPTSATLTSLGATRGYVATARGPVSECTTTGDVIDPSTLAWAWSSSLPATPLASPSVLNQAVFKAQAETYPASSTIRSTATQDAITRAGLSSLMVDLAYCSESTDCTKAGLCTGSTCDDATHRCTPVITDFSPRDGKIGTWVTVKGCYFGSYSPSTSKLTFNGQDGIGFTAAAYCPSLAETWTDTAITREVPNQATADTTDDATDGPIKVTRSDGLSDATNDATGVALPDYDVNTTERPGICALQPSAGLIGDPVTLHGQNFGSSRSGTDKVSFDATDVAGTDYTWSDPLGQRVDVKVPVGLPTDRDADVVLTNDVVSSNAMPFTVRSTTTPPGSAPPTVTAHSPVGPSVCRNSVVSATFSTAMDTSTFTSTNVRLEPCTNFDCTIVGAPLATTIRYGSRSVTLSAGLLTRNQQYRATVTTGVKSAAGVALAMDFSWTFTTADTDDVCALQAVTISLTPDGSAFRRFITLDDSSVAMAHAWSGVPFASDEIVRIPGVYDWTWQWTNTTPAVADYNPAPGDSELATVRPVGNGQTTLTATAKAKTPVAGFTGTRTSNAVVEVAICENPWDFTDADYGFSLFYCRGSVAAPSLPKLTLPALRKDSTGGCPADEPALNQACIQREYFFKRDLEPDYDIGIRVFPNTALLSPRGWFEKNFPAVAGGQTGTVDSYPSLTVGGTTYIAAAFPGGSSFTSKIYLLSVKDGAPDVAKSIASQLLQYWRFATPTDPSKKAAVANDMARVGDLRTIKERLDSALVSAGSVPQLTAGSFLTGISTSRWPSWSANLGTALPGTMPNDPLNTFAITPTTTCRIANGFEESTCWNQTKAQFSCPNDSHVYAYRADGIASFGLYANLEYTGAGTWSNGGFNPCVGTSGGSECSCFNYLVGTGPAAAAVDHAAPSTPASVRALASSESDITVGWSSSTDFESGVKGYEVSQSSVGSGGPFTVLPGLIMGTSTLVSTLSPGTTYWFRVSAQDYAGNVSAPGESSAAGEQTAPANIGSFGAT